MSNDPHDERDHALLHEAMHEAAGTASQDLLTEVGIASYLSRVRDIARANFERDGALQAVFMLVARTLPDGRAFDKPRLITMPPFDGLDAAGGTFADFVRALSKVVNAAGIVVIAEGCDVAGIPNTDRCAVVSCKHELWAGASRTWVAPIRLEGDVHRMAEWIEFPADESVDFFGTGHIVLTSNVLQMPPRTSPPDRRTAN